MSSPVTSSYYNPTTRQCIITFSIANDIPGPVFMYYRLTNFYQNHRRYVKSYDSTQLDGSAGLATPNSACSPLDVPGNPLIPPGSYPWVTNGTFPNNAVIYPCGLIANSYFSGLTYYFKKNERMCSQSCCILAKLLLLKK